MIFFPVASLLAALLADERSSGELLYGESFSPRPAPRKIASRIVSYEASLKRLLPVIDAMFELGLLDEAEFLDALATEMMDELEAIRIEMDEGGGDIEESGEGRMITASSPLTWFEPSLEESLISQWRAFNDQNYYTMKDDPIEEKAYQAGSYARIFKEHGLGDVDPLIAFAEAERLVAERELLRQRYKAKRLRSWPR